MLQLCWPKLALSCNMLAHFLGPKATPHLILAVWAPKGAPREAWKRPRKVPKTGPKSEQTLQNSMLQLCWAKLALSCNMLAHFLGPNANPHLILAVWVPKGAPREAWKRPRKVPKTSQNEQILVVFCSLQLCWPKLALSCNMLAHFLGPSATPHLFLAVGGRTIPLQAANNSSSRAGGEG